MSEPWSDAGSEPEPIGGKGALPTPTQAALWLIHMNRRGTEAIEEYKRLKHARDVAQKTATRTEAEWFLKQEGQPMDMRKWIAREAAAEAVFNRDQAQSQVEVQEELIRMLKAQMENVRSIGATAKEELRALGGQPG